jgi:hypothetical protein
MAVFSVMKRFLATVDACLGTRLVQTVLLLVLAIIYLIAYWMEPARPGASAAYPLGWWGWWDQEHYWRCAADLAHGHLSAETYWYPVGYSLLGAPFYAMMPTHAFLIPDLALVLGIAAVFYRIATKFVSRTETVVGLALFIVFYRGVLAQTMVVPFNTLPTHLLSYIILLLVGFGRVTGRRVIYAAVCVGGLYWCRPGDALCLGLLLGFAILRLPSWRVRIRVGLISALILMAFVACILLLNWSIFKTWKTPYEENTANIGFGSYSLAKKAFALVIDARPGFQLENTSLISHFPWLVLVPAGLVLLLRKSGWNAVGVIITIAATYMIYFVYNDFWPTNIFYYHLIHYLVWTVPLLALFAYIAVRDGWKDVAGRLGLLLPFFALVPVCFLTLEERVLGCVPRRDVASNTSLAVPKADWVLLTHAPASPNPFEPELGLTPFRGFFRFGRNDGTFILLSSQARKSGGMLTISEKASWDKLFYGQLDWRLRWPPRPFSQHTALAEPVIDLRHARDGIDVTGPQGIPDGRPDEIIDVQLKRDLGSAIADWDLETTDQRGRWLSQKNSVGWWLIRVDIVEPGEAPTDSIKFRLTFPDYGDFERASAFTLRATGIDGKLVINKVIQK